MKRILITLILSCAASTLWAGHFPPSSKIASLNDPFNTPNHEDFLLDDSLFSLIGSKQPITISQQTPPVPASITPPFSPRPSTKKKADYSLAALAPHVQATHPLAIPVAALLAAEAKRNGEKTPLLDTHLRNSGQKKTSNCCNLL